jgi:hypothetical protein
MMDPNSWSSARRKRKELVSDKFERFMKDVFGD